VIRGGTAKLPFIAGRPNVGSAIAGGWKRNFRKMEEKKRRVAGVVWIERAGADRLISRGTYDLRDCPVFYGGEPEVRAWDVSKGSDAEGGGSDSQVTSRGFYSREVCVE